jgi:uncharacterized phage-associated protein
MPTASEVAKYFLSLTDEDAGDTISNLKLQKLLYYAQGFHLALHGKPIFSDRIEAWRHGPVVRSVYGEYANYRDGSIPPPENFDPKTIDEESRELLDEVYRIYGQYSAWRLRDMTHDEPPWKDAWQKDGGEQEISHKALKKYFITLIDNEK